MTDVKLGGATVQRIEKSYEPNFDAKMFFPDRKPEVVQQHRGWLIPNHYDEASNSLKLSGSARQNRLAALEHCAGSGARLMPCHFNAPFTCCIDHKGSGFVPRFDAQD